MGVWSETWIHLEKAGGLPIARLVGWRATKLLTEPTGQISTKLLLKNICIFNNKICKFEPNYVSLAPDERWRLTQILDLRPQIAPNQILMTTTALRGVELCLMSQDHLQLVIRPCPLKPTRSEYTSWGDSVKFDVAMSWIKVRQKIYWRLSISQTRLGQFDLRGQMSLWQLRRHSSVK